MNLYYIEADVEYRGHLISIYKSDKDFEVRVREGNGMNREGDWTDSLYTNYAGTYEKALTLGIEFVSKPDKNVTDILKQADRLIKDAYLRGYHAGKESVKSV